MFINEYGDKNNPLFLLLAPMMVSGKDGYDFAKMMTKNFERITERDIDAICHACCHYDLRKLTKEEQGCSAP